LPTIKSRGKRVGSWKGLVMQEEVFGGLRIIEGETFLSQKIVRMGKTRTTPEPSVLIGRNPGKKRKNASPRGWEEEKKQLGN